MATSRLLVIICLLAGGSAGAREAASPTTCQAAAAKPPIVDAKTVLEGNPDDLRASFNLADAWSDAGCFNDAVQVLQTAQESHPGQKELETRLRVAKSLVGEEYFFDKLDRANAQARLKRESFRCSTLYDVDACSEAVSIKPDDPALLVAQGDSLLRAKRPAEAVARYRVAATIAPNQHDVAAKIRVAESQIPEPKAGSLAATSASPAVAPIANPAASASHTAAPRNAARGPLRIAVSPPPEASRRYTNAAPESQTH